MPLIQPRTPPGTLELLPREQMIFQHMLDVVRRGYERFGFVPVETPVFELKDVLLTKSGGETEKQVYFVQSTGAIQQGHDADLALRFDLTVPLARYVAEHEHQLAFPFRRYQIQRVYRGERAQKGRFREFYQCDIDVIGKGRLDAAYDAELPAIIVRIFEELKVGDFTIHFSNRKVLLGLLAQGVEDAEKQKLVLREIDKFDKIGGDKVRAALVELGLNATATDQLLHLIEHQGSKEEMLADLRKQKAQHPTFLQGVAEVAQMIEALKALGVPENRTRFNLKIARGLDYYTGTVYETLLDDHPEFGSVCSGGRYDDLASLYTKSKLPGVGLSIGLTRLFDQLRTAKLLPPIPNTVQVLIAQLDPQLSAAYLSLAAELRHAGFNTENYLEPAKLDKQLKYADKAGIPFVVLLGPDEKAKGTVLVKDFAAKTQIEVTHAALIEKLRTLISARPDMMHVRPSRPVADEMEFPFYRMRTPRILWVIPFLILFGILTVMGVLVRDEMHTSRLQAEWLSYYDHYIDFKMQAGPNPVMRAPGEGPYNQRLGYSFLPFFTKSLATEDYAVAAQARTSPVFNYFVDHGLYPVYRAKTTAGLALYDRDGRQIYSASYPAHVFANFESIPPLLVDTLLHIENRELLHAGPPTYNPVVEWRRFLYAAVGHAIQKFMPGLNAGGGSTLATQIEKFRYSPGGETHHPIDKLRQIASASLRVYQDGPDTTAARKKIVLDYLNSTPLSARAGFGEVNSIGDGLWAWFGIDLNDAITALNLPDTDSDSLRVRAHVYRAVLGLILAQRRPTSYLSADHGALDNLTDAALDRLTAAGVISMPLRDATKAATFKFIGDPPALPQPPYIEQKATNALRNHLLSMLGLTKLYELDRFDLAARTTLDEPTQKNTVNFLRKMGNREFLQSIGLYGFRLLDPTNDPTRINGSVMIYEKGASENKIRVQADNIDEPFDMNEGMKLDLGSTAKLRTLVTYLEIVGELHRRYAGLSGEDLLSLADDAPDTLTLWATNWLADHPHATLDKMLTAAMDRRYSANPDETFFTGGGEHHFVNFERKEDFQSYDLRDAFANSVNLVFVRLLRDIVNYTIAQAPQTRQELMGDTELEARHTYLERFADKEGSDFLNRFISDYENLSPDDVLEKLAAHGRKSAAACTILFRSARPQADFAAYAKFMNRHRGAEALDDERLQKLFGDYPVDRYSLADRAYIVGVNPLELWLVGYLQANPHATRTAILQVSQPVRIESYAWLFRSNLKHAQDTRIRMMLEADAFARIQKRWARLGYPFDHLVPSLATAIGSSADRPGALAELVGIILNDGKKKPSVRFESLQFGAGTPYQTLLIHQGDKQEQQVLDPAITHVVKDAMLGVVDDGTAKRVKGTYVDAAGQPYLIGGKTGTGDHRYDEFGAGGRLISSRVMNRTGTFVFYIGDKFFGTITAHVAGEDAADYKFTSALSAQMLKALAPVLQPLINGTPVEAENVRR